MNGNIEAVARPKSAKPKAIGAMGEWGAELAKVALVVVAILAVRAVIVNQYVVPSASMEPTLQVGDHIVVDMLAYGVRVPFTSLRIIQGEAPERGEVVVFHSPDSGERMVKRVVAVAGDTVEIREGQLFLGDVAAARPNAPTLEWFKGRPITIKIEANGGRPLPMTTIPPGKVLVLGDNRGNSVDGRHFGLVDEDAIFGKAVRVAYRKGSGFQWSRL